MSEKTENIEDLKPTHLQCRDLGHRWHKLNTEEAQLEGINKKPLFGVRRVTRCTICRTVRIELINTYGYVESRHYKYPDGYGLENSVRGKAAYRVEMMKREGLL